MPARAAFAAAALCCAGLAVAVVWVNARAGCATHDAPYAEFSCSARDDTDPGELLARLRSNPADLDALLRYVRVQRAAIPVLAGLWPNDAEVLRMRASDAITKGRWAEAAEPLTLLAAYDYSDPAAALIGRIAAGGNAAVFFPYLRPGSQWTRRVITASRNTEVPPAALVPLVTRAFRQGAVDPASLGTYIERLKSASAWVDAYALWVLFNREPVPLLYNGGFDNPFHADGFDWRIEPQPETARSGAFVERAPGEGRESALLIRLNGKRFNSPLISQDLLLLGAPVHLRGEFQTRRLRTDHGLRWVAECSGSRAIAGQSGDLANSSGGWQAFDFTISPPPDCGPVVRLRLETADPLEAQTGITGQILFDSLVVEPAAAATEARSSR